MLRALVRATHPLPAAAVTGLAAALASGVGRSPLRVAAAVGAGQASVGWCNDWRDAARDAAVARTDKPVATGALSAAAVRGAALGALAATVPLSLRLGRRAAAAHLAAVASAWSYDLGLKATPASGLPYAVSFGLLPAVAIGAPVPWWGTTGAALLGVGAHLANALPDLDADRATDVHNLAVVLGRRRTSAAAAVLLLAGTAVITAGPPDRPDPATVAGAAAAVVATVVGLRAPAGSVRPFRSAMVVAAIDVGLLVRHGGDLLPAGANAGRVDGRRGP